MTLTLSSSSPSAVSGFSSKGSFEEFSLAPSKGAADEELDDDVVVGGAEGKVGSGGEVVGVAEDAVAELASSGVRMTPPGGIFSLLYLHPGT